MDFKDLDFSGASNVNFSAPTYGDYAGLLFFQDRAATLLNSNMKFKIAGTVVTDFDGAIYLPNHTVEFSGTNDQVFNCNTMIISNRVNFNGTSFVQPVVPNCPNGGGNPIAAVDPETRLVR